MVPIKRFNYTPRQIHLALGIGHDQNLCLWVKFIKIVLCLAKDRKESKGFMTWERGSARKGGAVKVELKDKGRYDPTKTSRSSGRSEMRERKWLLSLLISFVAGCAPLISQEALREVDKNLSFQAVLANPDSFKGRTILLGGKIIETTPVEGKTRVTVLQFPLGFRDRPSVDSASEGRFIVEASGFLDPVVYSAGRQVTVAGTVEGKEVLPLGEINYTYPVVMSRELYLWPVEEGHYLPQFYIGIGIGKTF